MGKIDGTCGAFLSVVTPGDCRREDRLHLNRWHCEHKEREEINVQCSILKDSLIYNFISNISGQQFDKQGDLPGGGGHSLLLPWSLQRLYQGKHCKTFLPMVYPI